MSFGLRLKKFVKNFLFDRKAYQFFIRDWVALGDISRAADVLSTMRFSRNLEPIERDGPKAKRIVVLAPHPDDEIIGPGGTIIRAIDRGADVLTVYLTSGMPNEMAQRREETEAVAEVVGFQTKFLNMPAFHIQVDSESMSNLVDGIKSHSPDVIFIPFFLDDHDDHRRANELFWRAFKSDLLPGGLEVWAYQVYSVLPPGVVVDITDVSERKAEAIRGWPSQFKSRDWVHFSLGLNAFNSRFIKEKSDPRFAEVFFVLPVQDYVDLCAIYFGDDASSCYYAPSYLKKS
mgnify:CR=1 FL=1